MIIYNKQVCMESCNDCIKVNNVPISGDKFSIVKKIKSITEGIECLDVDNINDKLSTYDTILLLAISYNIQTLRDIQTQELYEITFSYHFPLYFEKQFIKILLQNLEIIQNADVVNLATKGEFVRINVSSKQDYKEFYQKHGYWIRHNDKIIDINIDNNKLNETLINWNLYCKSKFHKEFSQDAINSYKYIYSLPGFYVIEHNYHNKIIAQGVIYKSEQTNTLYYCIFWWNDYYKSLSPGKYNYEKVIQYCHQSNLTFSFCYGFQRYKFELIKFFKQSNSQKWVNLC